MLLLLYFCVLLQQYAHTLAHPLIIVWTGPGEKNCDGDNLQRSVAVAHSLLWGSEIIAAENFRVEPISSYSCSRAKLYVQPVAGRNRRMFASLTSFVYLCDDSILFFCFLRPKMLSQVPRLSLGWGVYQERNQEYVPVHKLSKLSTFWQKRLPWYTLVWYVFCECCRCSTSPFICGLSMP